MFVDRRKGEPPSRRTRAGERVAAVVEGRRRCLWSSSVIVRLPRRAWARDASLLSSASAVGLRGDAGRWKVHPSSASVWRRAQHVDTATRSPTCDIAQNTG